MLVAYKVNVDVWESEKVDLYPLKVKNLNIDYFINVNDKQHI